jgi:hypothetical protein
MLKRSTITVAAIAAFGVTLAFGASVVVQPLIAHPISKVAPKFQGQRHHVRPLATELTISNSRRLGRSV